MFSYQPFLNISKLGCILRDTLFGVSDQWIISLLSRSKPMRNKKLSATDKGKHHQIYLLNQANIIEVYK